MLHVYRYTRSALTYADRTWGPSLSNTNWKSAEAVQNICLLRIYTILAVPPHVIGIKPYCTLKSYLCLQYKNFTYAKNGNVQFYENSFSKFKHTRYPGFYSTGHPVTERKIRPISHGQKSKFKLTTFSKQQYSRTQYRLTPVTCGYI